MDSKPDTTASEPSSAHTPKIVRGNSGTRHSAGSGINGVRYKQISQRIEKFAAENQNQDLDPNTFEIQGKRVEEQKKPEAENQIEEFFENRILKPLPDYSYNPELRELAMSIQNEIININPGVNFANIVGLDEAKRLLKEAVLMPLKYPHFFEGILEPWKGILLFGPPGTGKTMLAKAVATECRTTFFNISASTIVSKWRGDSEKLVRVLFELARYHQPSTIFVDEVDSILSSRTGSGEHEASRRMKTELLIQLDGLIKSKGERVFLLAASNLPWDLDMALLRRLEKRILVPLPTAEAREAMVRYHLPPGPPESGARAEETIDYQEFSDKLEGYSGSDIKLVCKEAAMKPLRRVMKDLDVLEQRAAV